MKLNTATKQYIYNWLDLDGRASNVKDQLQYMYETDGEFFQTEEEVYSWVVAEVFSTNELDLDALKDETSNLIAIEQYEKFMNAVDWDYVVELIEERFWEKYKTIARDSMNNEWGIVER